MPDRVVNYQFRGDAGPLIREMAKAGAAAEVLDNRLDSVDGDTVRLKRSSASAAREGVQPLGQSMRKAGADIDKYSGRLRYAVEAVTLLGPSLVPLTSVAIPAISGMVSGLGALAGAAGVTVLAFQGVGDTLEALNQYQLEPTAENFAALQEEAEKLGVAGFEFVRYLDEVAPKFEELQRVAGDGLFPGLQDGLDDIVSLLPRVKTLVGDLAGEVGELAADAGSSLANDSDWTAFFDYLDTDAAPTLDALGRSLGNFTAGFANMIVGFAPLSRDFNQYMLDMSESFREWSANLGDNQDFQSFIAWVREEAPKAGDFFSALGSAMADLVVAIEPWGSAVLPILTNVLELFSDIASSPIGPALFTAGAAFLAFNRTMALTAATMTKFGAGGKAGVAGNASGVFGVMGDGAKKASTSVKNLRTDVRAMSREYGNLSGSRSAALSFFSGTTDAAKRTRSSLRGVAGAAGRAAAPVAAIGALSTGLADSMNLTNTATLGLAGSMAGPWGAAIGGGVGLVLDLASAYESAEERTKRYTDELNSAASAQELYNTKLSQNAETLANDIIDGGVTEEMIRAGDATSYLEDRTGSLRDAMERLAVANGEVLTGNEAQDWATLNRVWADAAPIMQELGISQADFANEGSFAVRSVREAYEALGIEAPSYMDQIIEKQQELGTQSGKLGSLEDALSGIGSEAKTAAQSADDLATSLDALFSPGQNLVAAQDAWTQGLRDLNDELTKVPDLVHGQSEAAIANRAAISEQVTDLKNLAVAQTDAGKGAGVVAKTLREGRQAIIDAGTAAGLAEPQIKDLLRTYGLTPKAIKTTLEVAGAKQAEKAAGAVGKKLVEVGGLKPRPTISVKDAASMAIKAVRAGLSGVAGMHPNPTIGARDAASGVIGGVRAALRAVDGDSATVYIRAQRIGAVVGATVAAALPQANGGIHRGGVQTYASGGLDRADRHMPEMARPTPTLRVWAEPETQGESYIPHANDYRRPRAKSILEQTAHMFGGQVAWFAEGGSPRTVQATRPVMGAGPGAAAASVKKPGKGWDGRLSLVLDDGTALSGYIAEIAEGQIEAADLLAAEHSRAS